MTRKLLKLALIFALFLADGALLAGQSRIPVTGHFGGVGTDTPSNFGVKFELQYCGSNLPRVFGIFNPVLTNTTLTVDPTTGLITGQIWPNDFLNCGGTVGGTRYNVTAMVNNVPQGPPVCYQVLSSVGTFNLDTAQPCVQVPPPPPPPGFGDYEFNNLTLTGTLNGVNAIFTGDVRALSFHFSTAGAHFTCPGGQAANSLLQDFTLGCVAFPGAPVTSVFGRVGPVVAAVNDYNFTQLAGTIADSQFLGSLHTYPIHVGEADLLTNTPTQATCGVTAGQALTGISITNAANIACSKTAVPAGLILSFDAAGADTCTPPTSTDSNCTGTITLPSSMGDANYSPTFGLTESSGAFLSITITGSITATTIPYVLSCTFNCSVVNQPVIHVIAAHH